jgi:hypothetical protein
MGQGIYNGIWWPDLEGGNIPDLEGYIIQENGVFIMSETNQNLIIE